MIRQSLSNELSPAGTYAYTEGSHHIISLVRRGEIVYRFRLGVDIVVDGSSGVRQLASSCYTYSK